MTFPHTIENGCAMTNVNLTLVAILGAFSLGLILGNAGHFAKLGIVLKSEYAPCSDKIQHHGAARLAAETHNHMTGTRGTLSSPFGNDINVSTQAGTSNTSLSRVRSIEKTIPALRGGTHETQEEATADAQNETHRASTENESTTSTDDTSTNDIDSANLTKGDGICSLIAQTAGGFPFSASHLWTTHFADILNASQHPLDPNFVHENWTKSLLASLTPSMLQQGLRTRPSLQALERVLKLIRRRILNPNVSPPLKIAVVGGSVTQGGGCNTPPVQMEGYEPMKYATDCAWPKRLEHLVNTLFGSDIIKVHNLAVGGTNLELATPLIKYWLYPDELLPDGPDVIISSYSTNEQHTYPYRIDTTNTTAFAALKRKRVNAFISAVHDARPCDDPPFLMFLDDYLGNQQDRILGEMTYNKIVTELAEWYGDVMHVSYADAVRRVVYANTEETIFTPAWPIEERGEFEGQHRVEPHFGMAGHVTIAWTLVFAIAQVIAAHCENKHFVEEMIRMKRETMIPSQVTELMNTVPPPKLTTDLMLSNVTEAWNEAARQRRETHDLTCSDNTYGKAPCSFAFIAGPAGTVRNGGQLTNYLKMFGVQAYGWEPVVDLAAGGWSKKLGLVASKSNATMTLKLENIEKEIRMFNLQTLKSYGDKWAGSKARFTLEVKNPGMAAWTDTLEIEGVHDSKTR